jgi:16S rRNA (uracil1498-N3)-methyltransferase
MTKHRFFIEPEVIKGGKFRLEKDQAQQIRKVLRLKENDQITLVDGSGIEYIGLLNVVANEFASGTIEGTIVSENEPKAKIILYQALAPREKIETVLQKGTEIGISEFVLVETQRSLLKTKDVKDDRLSRWRKIIKEAAEQSERGKLPTLNYVLKFKEAIDSALQFGEVYLAFEREATSVKEVLANLKAETVSIFIGPEGGFTSEEIDYAKEKGVKIVSLGKRILRTETAGLVFSAIILYSQSDLDL